MYKTIFKNPASPVPILGLRPRSARSQFFGLRNRVRILEKAFVTEPVSFGKLVETVSADQRTETRLAGPGPRRL